MAKPTGEARAQRGRSGGSGGDWPRLPPPLGLRARAWWPPRTVNRDSAACAAPGLQPLAVILWNVPGWGVKLPAFPMSYSWNLCRSSRRWVTTRGQRFPGLGIWGVGGRFLIHQAEGRVPAGPPSTTLLPSTCWKREEMERAGLTPAGPRGVWRPRWPRRHDEGHLCTHPLPFPPRPALGPSRYPGPSWHLLQLY